MKRTIKLNGKTSDIVQVAYESDLVIKKQYVLSNQRDGGESHELELDDDDHIELTFDDNTSWYGSVDTLDKIFPQMKNEKRGLTTIELPTSLQEDGNDKRGIGGIALKLLTVFARKKITKSIKDLAVQHELKSLENKSGLYQVDADLNLLPLGNIQNDSTYLLFIHGTFSSTKGSFAELCHSKTFEVFQQTYCNVQQNRMLAFQHETLSKSVLHNVADLVSQLPERCNLHIITHSRGGLVGDTLCLFAENELGFNKDIYNLFVKEKRSEDVKQIDAIRKAIKGKKIIIEKYIRVACPAFGTSLLSNGIDNFLNVLMNLASVTSLNNPIVGSCKELLNAVIQSKSDVKVLPGLEVMNPNSVFLKSLNAKTALLEKANKQLCVISGNSELSLSFKAVKVILMRLVFQHENDLVVNTLSMYQGVPRKFKLQYFFDEGSDVSHVTYFKNEKTQKAIASVINATGIQIPGFVEYNQEIISDSDRGVFGLEGGKVMKQSISGNKPIVILLPGIMGSNLDKNNRSVWINYGRLLVGELTTLKISEPNIKATSLIKTSYKDLVDFLSDSHDVITFPFDWRKSLTVAGNELNMYIKQLLTNKVINDKKLAIRIVAHSMGGLVARELLLNHETTWNALNNLNGFKYLMLGTPWLGSFRIPSVLSGNDSIIKMIAKLDVLHSQDELIDIFSKFPGLLNLLPIHGDYDFSQENTWRTFQQATGLNWSIPDKAMITEFGLFQKNVKQKLQRLRPEMFQHVIYVAGKDDTTPSNYTITNNKVNIVYTNEGDQSVTWASGIPAQINQLEALYYVNVSHGGLSCDESLFEGFKEILLKGGTNRFERTKDKIVSATRSVKVQEQDVFELNEENTYRTLLGIRTKKLKPVRQLPAIKLSVSNGDLQFSSYPVMIGHFFKDGIISAERSADKKLNDILSKKHSLGIYPGPVGTYLIELGEDANFFKGAIIIGIGQAEELTLKNISTSVEKAMLSYMSNHCQRKESSDIDKVNGISCLLVGSFYGGIPIRDSVRAIVQGVASANRKVDIEFANEINLIEHIEFIELFDDRALQCFHTINKMINANNEELQIEWMKKSISKLYGSHKRIIEDSGQDWWNRFIVKLDRRSDNPNMQKLIFSSSTHAAREDNQDLFTNFNLTESFIQDISEEDKWTPEKSVTLFELLIPNYFKHNIQSQNNMAWIVDKFTASLPWELLQTSLDTKPVCIGAKMVRQLATYDTSKIINPSKSNRALVIGDPELSGFTKAPQLLGAQKEAKLVFQKLRDTNYDIESPMINKRKDDILSALLKTDYKIIHLAGHGFFDANDPFNSGMLIGKQEEVDEPYLLTTKEITQMSSTPELVFVNCCYLGKVNMDAEEYMRNRYKLAANIGTQLIENGVNAVIVAGWAVDDDAALKFADVFYSEMLDGNSFGNAVHEARKKTFNEHPYTNTWGAYQCYGDPYYKLRSFKVDKPWKPKFTVPEEIEIELHNLKNDSELPRKNLKKLQENLSAISDSARESSLLSAKVVEQEAFAYLVLNDYEKAIQKFRSLFDFEEADYSIKAIEQFNNLLIKYEYLKVNQLAKAGKYDDITTASLDVIVGATNALYILLQISKNSERFKLLGSAYKRKAAILYWLDKPQEEVEESLRLSIDYYKQAASIIYESETRGEKPMRSKFIYPYCNHLELEIILAFYHEKELSNKENIVKRLLATRVQFNYNRYWDRLYHANIELCLCMLDESTEQKVTDAYESVWNFYGSDFKKQTEIEHFSLLIDFCDYFHFDEKRDMIERMKKDLERMMKNRV